MILRIFDFQSGAFKDAESNPVSTSEKNRQIKNQDYTLAEYVVFFFKAELLRMLKAILSRSLRKESSAERWAFCLVLSQVKLERQQ